MKSNTYGPHMGATNYLEETLLESQPQTDPSIILWVNFSTPLSAIARSSRIIQ